jgi:hypothetical protein
MSRAWELFAPPPQTHKEKKDAPSFNDATQLVATIFGLK